MGKVMEDTDKWERSDINKDVRQRKKLREPLDLGESVYVLAKRLKKKDALGGLYKNSTENKPFFNQNKIFTVRERLHNGQELLALRGQLIQFIMEPIYIYVNIVECDSEKKKKLWDLEKKMKMMKIFSTEK